MIRPKSRECLIRMASFSALAVYGCGDSTPPPAPSVSPPSAAAATSSTARSPAASSDPIATHRQLIEALKAKVQLIAAVQDVASARAVSDRFPEAERRHRELDGQFRNSLLTDLQRQEIAQQFGSQLAELEKSWNEQYVRVVLIPGAWEHMNPELAPFADLTVYPEDAAGLESAVVGLLQKAIEIQRQVTNVETAKELSARYRASIARIGVLLARLNKARGVPGGQEADSPTVRQLRREFDAEWQRIARLSDAARVLNGEGVRAVVAVDSTADWAPLLTELRSGDQVRVRNTLNQMGSLQPPPAWKVEVFPDVVKLLEFEPVRGSAVELLKKGWFGPDQVATVFEVADGLSDNGLKEDLYEGISRLPNLGTAEIERLAALFPTSTGRTVQLLRNVGPNAEPVAQSFAGHEKEGVRIGVCEVLRDIGSPASAEVLQKLAEDPDRGVASKANEALREIAKPDSQRPHLRDR